MDRTLTVAARSEPIPATTGSLPGAMTGASVRKSNRLLSEAFCAADTKKNLRFRYRLKDAPKISVIPN